MVAEVMSPEELTDRMRQRRWRHEAAHATVIWLMDGQVVAIGHGWCQSVEPDPARKAISSLAGPAHDAIELAWLRPEHLQLPEMRQEEAFVASVTGPNDEPREDDDEKARSHLSRLGHDPADLEQLYRRAQAIAARIVGDADVRRVIDEVAEALSDSGEMGGDDFDAVVRRYSVLHQMYVFAAPWVELQPRTANAPR